MKTEELIVEGSGADTPDGERPLARTRKSQKKRDAIMAAAIEILNTRTYALATMTEIAASLDLRDATLYYYFSNKQALFYACHVQSMDRFEGFLDRADSEGGTGAAKLERFLFHLVDDSAKQGPLLYFGDYFHLEPAHRAAVATRAEELTAKLEAFLTIGIADASIRPCETGLVVQLLLGMLIWLAKWVPTVDDLTADRLLAAIGVFSLEGLKRQMVAEPEPKSGA